MPASFISNRLPNLRRRSRIVRRSAAKPITSASSTATATLTQNSQA
jgi:hypothetical protein